MTKTRTTLFFSLILTIAMIMVLNINAFAANPPTHNFHKCNGIGNQTGAGGEYTSTITKPCTKITVWGDSDSPYKTVTVHVYAGTSSKSKLVAQKTVTLNDTEQVLKTFYTEKLLPGTYRIVITTSDTKPYEVGTYFYE